VLVALRQQLAHVRELAVDQPRGEHDAGRLEHDLVRPQRDGDPLGRAVLDDPRELLQRPRRHVGLECAVERRLELGVLDGEAVAVGRRHPQLLLAGRDEDAGQHRARLVARRGARHLHHGLDERGPWDVDALVALRLRERREVLEAQRADVEGRRARGELDVLLRSAQLERQLVGR
jgi:hypothetical protein